MADSPSFGRFEMLSPASPLYSIQTRSSEKIPKSDLLNDARPGQTVNSPKAGQTAMTFQTVGYKHLCLDKKNLKRTIVLMKIIADTNIFLAVILHEPERDQIIRCTLGHDMIAPEILPFEIGNALSALSKRGRIESDNLLPAWDATQQIPVDLRSVNIRDALEIASRFNIYAYDAYFLVCALSLHCPLMTLDRRMIEVAQSLNIQIVEVT
jgi:predicted nucleic acid-binding protein